MKHLKISSLVLILIFALALPALSGSDKKENGTEKKASKNVRIVWHEYDRGLELAREQDKKVFVEFTTTWCGWCKKMHATTFKDQKVIDLMNDYYIAVSVDGDSRDSLNIDGWITTEKGLTKSYGVRGYPTYWFLSPESEKLAPMSGYKDKQSLAYILDYLKDDLYKTVTFEEYLKEKQAEEKSK